MVGDDGTWSIAVTSLLATGAKTLSAVASGVAGNVVSSSLTVTLDQTGPDMTAPVVAGGRSLSGHADPNATVAITDDGLTVRTVEANAQGVWSLDPTGKVAAGGHRGAAVHTGATLAVSFNNGTGATGNVTVAGLSTSSANLSVTTGQSGGVDYPMVTRVSWPLETARNRRHPAGGFRVSTRRGMARGRDQCAL